MLTANDVMIVSMLQLCVVIYNETGGYNQFGNRHQGLEECWPKFEQGLEECWPKFEKECWPKFEDH